VPSSLLDIRSRHWLAYLLLVAAASAFGAAPPPAPPAAPPTWQDLSPEDRDARLLKLSSLPLETRILEVSRRFLGTPYLLSPLGEGEGLDPDPPLRWDAVDCLTFVEETIAIALAKRSDQIEPILQTLRYNGPATYENRNHLMEAEWLPHNIEKGFLADVTDLYGGQDVQDAPKTLTAASWRSRSSQALLLPPHRQLKGSYLLRVLPLDKVTTYAPSIPTATLLVVVREDLPLKVTRVTHVGWWIRKGERVFIRHAQSFGLSRVRDEPLERFLARTVKPARWKVVGLSFFEVREPPKARLTRENR
jgi:hypothetical protein